MKKFLFQLGRRIRNDAVFLLLMKPYSSILPWVMISRYVCLEKNSKTPILWCSRIAMFMFFELKSLMKTFNRVHCSSDWTFNSGSQHCLHSVRRPSLIGYRSSRARTIHRINGRLTSEKYIQNFRLCIIASVRAHCGLRPIRFIQLGYG